MGRRASVGTLEGARGHSLTARASLGNRSQRALLNGVVSAQDVLNVIRPLVGLTESPPGSNRTLIGQWYGFDGVPWCAETVSYGLYSGGFNDGAGHISLAEPTTDRGWAYVPFLEKAFRDAGAFDQNPHVGDAVIFDWNGDGLGDHTGLVESINDDGTLNTLEGNVASQLKRERRGPGPARAGTCHRRCLVP